MTIVDVLRSKVGTRLVYENRWLWWKDEEWVILQIGAEIKCLGQTEDESLAVACLLYGEEVK